MGSRRKPAVTTEQGNNGAAPSTESVSASASSTVVLIRDSIDARGKRCQAGMTIAPDVDGWPDHRVEQHMRDKLAE